MQNDNRPAPPRYDGLTRVIHDGGLQTLWAGGSRGEHARADGRGGTLARGYHLQVRDRSLFGPYRTRRQAALAAAGA
jgi:hypothetical protein